MPEKIVVSSELMKNHKHAEIISPTEKFEALQTAEQHSLFFSIDTNNIFRLTKESTDTKTGWESIDLSSSLSTLHNGATITAKTFAVAQSLDMKTIDMILAVTVGEKDYLYFAQNKLNTDASWGSNITWQYLAYDDPYHTRSQISVADVYITHAPDGEYIVTDILKNPGDSAQFVFRYYIDPLKTNSEHIWNPQDLPIDLEADKIDSCLGRANQEDIDGIYTLGHIGSEHELIYIPVFNEDGESDNTSSSSPPPPSARSLNVPSDASAMAATTAINEQYTDLFVAGDKKLYYFSYENQTDGSEPVVVSTNNLFANVRNLSAHTGQSKVVVWGLNNSNEIFYLTCDRHNLTDPNAWSHPVPILTGVEQITSFINHKSQNNVIFAHVGNSQLIQLTQDSQTFIWHQRQILLPSQDVKKSAAFNSYTTHIQITGDDNLPMQDVNLHITSTSQCSVYVEDLYYILSPEAPVTIKTDSTGTATIVQATEGMGSVCYQIKLDSGTTMDVNPMSKAVQKIAEIKTGSDLGNVTVPNEDGTTKKLIPEGTPTADLNQAVKGLQQMTTLAQQKMPQDGSKRSSSTLNNGGEPVASLTEQPVTSWGLSFGPDGVEYREGDAAITHYGFMVNATGKLGASESSIEIAIGDLFSWLKHAIEDAEHFVVHLVDDVYQFVVQIAGEVYQAVVDCYNDVVHGIEFVLNKIGAFFEDLIKWVGFIFQWDDILRTHKVLKNITKQYADYSTKKIGTYTQDVHKFFVYLKSQINDWAHLQPSSDSLSTKSSSNHGLQGQHDPQSHWGTYHLKHNVKSSTGNVTTALNSSGLQSSIQDLQNLINGEEATFQRAYQTLQTDVIDKIQTLSANEIIEKFVAIFADLIIETTENIVVSALDIMKILVKSVIDILETPIDIPVISSLYEEFVGEQLTMLDVTCLVVAIPSTIIYKATYEEAPYPDNSFTAALINAHSWAALQAQFDSTVVHSQQNALATQGTQMLSGEEHNHHTILRFIMGTTSLIGSIGLAATSAIKYIFPITESTEKEAKLLYGINGALFFAATAPKIASQLLPSTESPSGEDIKLFDHMLYDFTAVLNIIDIFSWNEEDETLKPIFEMNEWLDFVSGILGAGIAIAEVAEHHDTKGITEFLSGVSWEINDILSPFIKENEDAFIIKELGILSYGLGQQILVIEEAA